MKTVISLICWFYFAVGVLFGLAPIVGWVILMILFGMSDGDDPGEWLDCLTYRLPLACHWCWFLLAWFSPPVWRVIGLKWPAKLWQLLVGSHNRRKGPVSRLYHLVF